MSLTLIATFNTKDEANRATDALVDAGWDRRAVSTTVRRELSSRPQSSHSGADEADAIKAIALVAVIGAIIGGVIGLILAYGIFGLRIDHFAGHPHFGFIAGAIAGLAVGTYSGAVASVRKSRESKFENLSPYLSSKERVMVSLTVPDERQEAISKVLRRHGAYAVREWSLITNDSPTGLRV